MIDKKSSRDSSNPCETSSTTNGTIVAADRTKDILTYQALSQNEIFETEVDSLYDEYHINSSYSNVNSNHHHKTGTKNPNGTNDTTINP